MPQNRVVITGLGIISSCGIGKENFFAALAGGKSGIRPISLFDITPYEYKTAGEITDFNPQEFLGAKGLRTLDRSTKLALSATKLALDDAGVSVTTENTQDIGVALGNTFGSLSSICDFDKSAIIEGPQYVNPSFFPNTVINSPASEISIKFNIKGFNATISTGFSASLDSIKYAWDFLRLGRINFVLAGGVEELCEPLFLGFYRTGLLAKGLVLGEGAGIIMLESLDSAKARGAHIYAELLGFGSGFGEDGLKIAMQAAIDNAGIKPEEISHISKAANSIVENDNLESRVIREVFGAALQKISLTGIKTLTGECFSASGALQVAAACAALENLPSAKILINAVNPEARQAALVIAKYKG